jgi:hypothetical protein
MPGSQRWPLPAVGRNRRRSVGRPASGSTLRTNIIGLNTRPRLRKRGAKSTIRITPPWES